MVIAVSDGVPGTWETTKIEIITAVVTARVAEGRFTTLPFVRELAVLIRPILPAIEVLVTGFIQFSVFTVDGVVPYSMSNHPGSIIKNNTLQ